MARRTREHVHSCAACGSEWTSFERLRILTRALPPVALAPEELEAVRTALLVESQRALATLTPRRIWLSVPAVVAVLALSSLFHARERATGEAAGPKLETRSSPLPKPRRGVVRSGPAAVFALLREQPDEVVRLREGEITVEVEPLSAAERFRVMTGDAEIEVKGTAFSAVARENRLMDVIVVRGLVVVRARARDAVTLGPGERWEAPGVAHDGGVPRPRRTHHRSGALRPSGRATTLILAGRPSVVEPTSSLSPAESAFGDGWQALRAQHLPDAEDAFARAAAYAGTQPLAEDAWFWMAVCQARIPRPAAARSSLAAFIGRFPRSPRIGEAAAMLGWMLVEDGDLEGAARRFATAARDPASEVRKSANRGLRAVARRRADGEE